MNKARLSGANKVVGWILFTVFAAAVLFWTATLTYSLVRRLMPGDDITPIFALALFDGGALIWLNTFKNKASGKWQRGISLIMTCLDLLGVVIMSGGEIILGGQSYVAVGDVGKYVVYALGAWTMLNLVGLYGYHGTDPDFLQKSTVEDYRDDMVEESNQLLKSKMQTIAAQVTDARAYEETLLALRSLLPAGTPADVIELYARPVEHKRPGGEVISQSPIYTQPSPTLPERAQLAPPPVGYDYEKMPLQGGGFSWVLVPVGNTSVLQPAPVIQSTHLNGNGSKNAVAGSGN